MAGQWNQLISTSLTRDKAVPDVLRLLAEAGVLLARRVRRRVADRFFPPRLIKYCVSYWWTLRAVYRLGCYGVTFLGWLRPVRVLPELPTLQTRGAKRVKTEWHSSDYRSTIAWVLVALMGALNIFRGTVHTFLPDGGAGVIAGFDLTHARQTILFLFAVMGVQQLSLGVVDLIIAFRVRSLALAALWFHTLQQTLAEAVFHFYKPAPGHPPGMVGGPVVLAVLWLALGWIYWRRSSDKALISDVLTSSQ